MGNCLKITENIRGEPEDSLIAGGASRGVDRTKALLQGQGIAREVGKPSMRLLNILGSFF